MSEHHSHTESTSDSARILAYQQAYRRLPQIFAVYVRCDNEDTVEALYEERGDAEEAVAGINAKPAYYGRARIVPTRVVTHAVHVLLKGPLSDETVTEKNSG